MKQIVLLFSALLVFTTWGTCQLCDGEVFQGQIRWEAKTTIGSGAIEDMTVLEFLTEFSTHPELDDDSPRSEIEQKNVRITCWLYTYARESDEDFHLILANTDKKTGRKFISGEISGLPVDGDSKDYPRLKKARDQFKTEILNGGDYCSSFTKKYLKKPIKVTVTGSVFYDSHHREGGSGPKGYKALTAWEIHPITSIKRAEPED